MLCVALSIYSIFFQAGLTCDISHFGIQKKRWTSSTHNFIFWNIFQFPQGEPCQAGISRAHSSTYIGYNSICHDRRSPPCSIHTYPSLKLTVISPENGGGGLEARRFLLETTIFRGRHFAVSYVWGSVTLRHLRSWRRIWVWEMVKMHNLYLRDWNWCDLAAVDSRCQMKRGELWCLYIHMIKWYIMSCLYFFLPDSIVLGLNWGCKWITIAITIYGDTFLYKYHVSYICLAIKWSPLVAYFQMQVHINGVSWFP